MSNFGKSSARPCAPAPKKPPSKPVAKTGKEKPSDRLNPKTVDPVSNLRDNLLLINSTFIFGHSSNITKGIKFGYSCSLGKFLHDTPSNPAQCDRNEGWLSHKCMNSLREHE